MLELSFGLPSTWLTPARSVITDLNIKFSSLKRLNASTAREKRDNQL